MATIENARTNIELLRPPSPRLGAQRYVQIIAKEARGMLAPSPSEPQSTLANQPSQSNAPGKYPLRDAAKLSDVPCYTCRRRHVKCDRILPHCAKCAKKGVACLGYKKPLRWADSVTVRGKLKSKTLPAVDSQAGHIARLVYQKSCRSIPKETSCFGLHTTDNCSFDIAVNDASFLDLINYHNTKICVEQLDSDIATKVVRSVAPLSPEAVQTLPRDLLNCILGNAAVHMAAKNPGNRAIEHLALVAKAKLLQRMNQLFQNPKEQHADLLLCCITLLFALESMEHRLTGWSPHFAGALKLLASHGGMENFAIRYPHMKSVLALTLHFDTLQVFFVPHQIDGPRIASRKGLETICYDSNVRKSFFVLCPLKLMQGIYDMGTCLQNILRAQGIPSLAEVSKREWILSDVLCFQPEDGTQNVKENYYTNQELTPLEYRAWNLVFTSWRAAIVIVVLRHLYFGLPDPRTTLGNSSTPSIIKHGVGQTSHYDKHLDFLLDSDNVDANYLFVENVGQDQDHELLSTEQPIAAPTSQTPPPLSSSGISNESMTMTFSNRRIDLHNEAFAELYKSLAAIKQNIDQNLDQQFLRFILIPTMILALVSLANSSERALCLDTFEQFKRYMAEAAMLGAHGPKSNPVGGASLGFEIPWDKLDAYNDRVEQERRENVVFGKDGPCNCAPEWNWWYMLKHMELKTLWPISAGTMHMELGTDLWSFSVLSALIVDDCIEAFMTR